MNKYLLILATLFILGCNSNQNSNLKLTKINDPIPKTHTLYINEKNNIIFMNNIVNLSDLNLFINNNNINKFIINAHPDTKFKKLSSVIQVLKDNNISNISFKTTIE
jgi:biopolymer transport protein ExbD